MKVRPQLPLAELERLERIEKDAAHSKRLRIIILAINGRPVGVDGLIDFEGERIDLRVIPDLMQINDMVDFDMVSFLQTS